MGKKQKNRSTFLPPTRYPQNNTALTMQVIKAQHDRELTNASNNGFNLAASGMIIAAYDMGLRGDYLKELLSRCFGVLDDVADSLSTIDSMMKLVESWGIEIYRSSEEHTNENGKTLLLKTAVIQLLEEGVEEVEDIVAKCKSHNIKIEARDVFAIRWEYNRRKYYSSFSEVVDMSKKDKALSLLDVGASKEQIMDQLDCTLHAVHNYTWMWNKETPKEREERKERMNNMASKKKERAFNLISRGASIEDIVKEMGITDKSAHRYLDLYREEKCEGEIEVMTGIMKEAFELFDRAFTDAMVKDKLQLGMATIKNYRAEWIRINKRDLSTDEMSDILAGRDASVVILEHKKVIEKKMGDEVNETKEKVKKHFEASKAGKADERASETEGSSREEKKEEPANLQTETESGEVTVNNTCENVTKEPENVTELPKYEYCKIVNGLKQKVEVIEVVKGIEGEFATYTPCGNDFDVEIDGQIINLNREALRTLAREFNAIAEMSL